MPLGEKMELSGTSECESRIDSSLLRKNETVYYQKQANGVLPVGTLNSVRPWETQAVTYFRSSLGLCRSKSGLEGLAAVGVVNSGGVSRQWVI